MVDRDTIMKYREALAYLTAKDPFFGYILAKLRAVADESVETAAVDNWGRLVINPKFFNKLSVQDRAFVIAHEAMHIIAKDLERSYGKDMKLWNIVTDAWNNEALINSGIAPYSLRDKIITLDSIRRTLGINVSMNMAKEEIYNLVAQSRKKEETGIPYKKALVPQGEEGEGIGDLYKKTHGDISVGANPSAPTVYEGDPGMYDEEGRMLPGAVDYAVKVAKARGLRGSSTVDRIIDEIYTPKIPWKVLLRQLLTRALRGQKRWSWTKISRKVPGVIPGRFPMGRKRVWVGMDVSGSITNEEYGQFVAEVHGIMSATGVPVTVVTWADVVLDAFPLTSKSQVMARLSKYRKTGATEPKSFLSYVYENMSPKDAVVVLTDGVFDTDPEMESLAREVASKSSVAIVVYTEKEVDWPGWRAIKMED